MAARKAKKTAKKTASKPARKPATPDSDTPNTNTGDAPADSGTTQPRKPPKPREVRTIENVFVVVETIDVSDDDTKADPDQRHEHEREILDVSFDRASADFICAARGRYVTAESLEAVESVVVEERKAIVITTKAGAGRGKKAESKTDIFLLDPDAKQPLEAESSDGATQARARREALALLTPEQREALGFEPGESTEDPFEE